MKKIIGFLSVTASLWLLACGDDSSAGPSNLTYIDENGQQKVIEVSTGSFKDPRDGKSYSTVTVGDQTWMSENLAYVIEYPRQQPPPEGSDPLSLQLYALNLAASATIEHNPLDDEKYSWAEAQIACPEGWHLPLPKEWFALFTTIENVYGDSAAWALKSRGGWNNDTLDGQIVSGNGGDILGFNAKPTGITRGGIVHYEGEMTGFWTQSPKDGDGYALYYRFETGTSWYSNEIYSLSDLHVRCVSDKNTLFESLNKCTKENDGEMAEVDSNYYVCRNLLWSNPTMEEKLLFVFGECDSTKANQRFMLQDTSFICNEWRGTTIVGATSTQAGTLAEATAYSWRYTPKDSVLADCSARGDTLCTYRDSTFHLSGSYWSADE